MTSHAHKGSSWAHALLPWLITAGLGPAVVAVPVNWAAEALVGAAQRWFRRLWRIDDLSRLVKAATGISVDLTHGEFGAVRRLLEDKHTWSLLRQGTVEDLAAQIASCLPPRAGRVPKDSHAAALAIARGLLEFAVADLEPKLFQQVVMARLQRMDDRQATALDEALLGMQAELVARLERQGELNAHHYSTLMGHLSRILDHLPPGPAGLSEIVVYLKTVIGWLNADPWPHRFDQPALTPAAIECKLQVTVAGASREQGLDADALARECRRLVILGGPGTGKTWLAKRTARICAEDALEALANGRDVDEVEFPLYTTCSELFSASGDIRQSVVSSALNQLSDLGGSRISAALRMFFIERNAPTLLVVDSLDEARGSEERLRQADTLPWRIVLTSRASSWKHQLGIEKHDESHRVVDLQPLRYPQDVESFVEHWFAAERNQAKHLTGQIARRRDLQQAATVPLILAFFCIVGGSEPLPEFRRDLYPRVLNRLLTGRWRGSGERRLDAATCLKILRTWAWSGAASHPVSGVGTWADDIAAEPAWLGEAEQSALDHIASPLGYPDVDTGKTQRRFIHRSIREHLVAEHVASLPVDRAAEALLPHIWYDPDWESVAPAALTMHPHHDQVLRDVISRAARSTQIPEDLSVIDAGWEFREFLARVGNESTEADWSTEVARMIGQARVQLAVSGHTGALRGADAWETSDREARDGLLNMLADRVNGREATRLVNGLVQLEPTTEDKRQARETLLSKLAHGDEVHILSLVERLVQLEPTAEDKRQACGTLLSWIAHADKASSVGLGFLMVKVVQLAPTAQDKRQLCRALLGSLTEIGYGMTLAEVVHTLDENLAGGIAELAPTAEDKRRLRRALLGSLTDLITYGMVPVIVGNVIQLTPTADDKRQTRDALLNLLANTHIWNTTALVDGLVQLAPTADDKRQTRDALLGLLADGKNISLVDGLAQLAPTAHDKRQTRDALLNLLAVQTTSFAVTELASGIARLEPTYKDRRQLCGALLGLLADQTNSWQAQSLVDAAVQLAAAEDKHETRDTLLSLLADQTNSFMFPGLARGVARLARTADDKRQARDTLLNLLTDQVNEREATKLVDGLVQLNPTAEDMRQAREALLRLLARQDSGWTVKDLIGALAQLEPTAEDKRQACVAVLIALTRVAPAVPSDEPDWTVKDLVQWLSRFTATAEDKRQAREALLGLLGGRISYRAVYALLEGVTQLTQTAEDRRQVREALLGLLAGIHTGGSEVGFMVDAVVQLAATAEDRRQARGALLGFLAQADQTSGFVVDQFLDGVARLDPTVYDLDALLALAFPPTIRLLKAVRYNSALAAWLAVLPSVASLSQSIS